MTNDDQKAISSLYETARASVPESLKKQLDQVAKDIGIEQLTGSKVSAVLEKAGMATASSSAPEKRYIVKLKDGKKLSSFKSKAQSSGVKALEPLGKNKTEFKDMYVVEMKESRSAGFKAAAKQYQTQLPRSPRCLKWNSSNRFSNMKHCQRTPSIHINGRSKITAKPCCECRYTI